MKRKYILIGIIIILLVTAVVSGYRQGMKKMIPYPDTIFTIIHDQYLLPSTILYTRNWQASTNGWVESNTMEAIYYDMDGKQGYELFTTNESYRIVWNHGSHYLVTVCLIDGNAWSSYLLYLKQYSNHYELIDWIGGGSVSYGGIDEDSVLVKNNKIYYREFIRPSNLLERTEIQTTRRPFVDCKAFTVAYEYYQYDMDSKQTKSMGLKLVDSQDSYFYGDSYKAWLVKHGPWLYSNDEVIAFVNYMDGFDDWAVVD